MSLWSVRFVVATLSLLTACADDEVLDAPELLDASADPEREVQSFVLPSRRDVSESRFELVEAFPSLTFEDPVAMVEADGRLYVVERPGRIYSFVPDERREREDARARSIGSLDQHLELRDARDRDAPALW